LLSAESKLYIVFNILLLFNLLIDILYILGIKIIVIWDVGKLRN